MTNVEELLTRNGIKPTSVRILVIKCILASTGPVSLSEIEEKLESVDKSSISRALNLFRENHLIHSFNDGSGSTKYEICNAGNSDEEEDRHVHFHCEKCGQTICLADILLPQVNLPEGFVRHEASYIISGVCMKCNTVK